LLPNDKLRSNGSDEAEEVGPEMTRVFLPEPFARLAVRLAGDGPGDESSVSVQPSHSNSERPAPDSGEEMQLVVSSQVFGLDIRDAPRVDVASRDQTGLDKVANPLGSIRVELVVVDGHFRTLQMKPATVKNAMYRMTATRSHPHPTSSGEQLVEQ
jgi:hypothetical protein